MKFFFTNRNSLLYPFWIMTLSIILLTLLSQFLIEHSLNDIKNEGSLIDVANDQGTRSLMLVKEIAADRLEGSTVGLPLNIIRDSLYAIQNTILTPKDHPNSPFVTEYRALDKAFGTFNAILEVAVTGTDDYSFVKLMNEQETYLNQLDKLVVAVDAFSTNKIHRFKLFQALIMLCSVTVIILEAIFIFMPTIKRINQQNDQLKNIAFNQSHLVRRPLANIKGLLNLTNIACSEEEKDELLELIKEEANNLDDVIRNTVKQTVSPDSHPAQLAAVPEYVI